MLVTFNSPFARESSPITSVHREGQCTASVVPAPNEPTEIKCIAAEQRSRAKWPRQPCASAGCFQKVHGAKARLHPDRAL